MQKLAIFHKIKKINELHAEIQAVCLRVIPQIYTEFAEKGHFWVETN